MRGYRKKIDSSATGFAFQGILATPDLAANLGDFLDSITQLFQKNYDFAPYAPSNSNRFIRYPGFGFQRRRCTKPASFWLTGETEFGAHTYPASQSTFGSAVRARFSPRDRSERVEGSVKRG